VRRYREALPRGGTPQLHYNLGTALLGTGEPQDAGEELSSALSARDPELRARVFYNLGNAYLRAAASGDAEGERQLRASIDAYRRSLLLEPGRQDTRWNLELALRRLREQERSQQSTGGDRAQSQSQPRDESGDRRSEGSGSPAPPAPRTGQQPIKPQPGDLSPLPPSLAEQVLRGVEEQERGLQREKLRQQHPTRRTGPDW
jgi:tetratricopeptide (TPR) repeat protein